MSAEFKLEMQDSPRMNERLDDMSELVGETILVVFDADLLAGEMVIVTENRNWIVLAAEADGCGEDPYISVSKSVFYGKEKTLADFVKAKPLFDAGCINHGTYAELAAKEAGAEELRRKSEADRLRARLASLEAAK